MNYIIKMFITKSKEYLLYASILLTCFGCRDPWEEHTKIDDGVVNLNIVELIANNPDLSVFKGYLETTGWDLILAGTKSYTVWAPDNNAMNSVAEEILTDEEQLYRFVSNHICYSRHSYYSTKELQRVLTFAEKYITINNQNGTVDDILLKEPYDIYAINGILHIIGQPLIPRPNLWDFIESTGLCPKYTGYLKSFSGMVFDPKIATQTGVDPTTGKPVYDTLTGMVWSNYFINTIRDLRDEDLFSTVILLTDEMFDQEIEKFRKYYNVLNAERTDSITTWQVLKDLVFDSKIEQPVVQDTIISMFGIKVPFNSNSIVATYIASNGIAYIMDNCAVRVQDKIHPVYIQGEDTTRIIYIGNNGQTGYTRQKPEAMNGYDFILDNHNANPGNIKYHAGMVCATKYKFYWKAVNDFNASYRNPNPDLQLIQKLHKVEFKGSVGGIMQFGDPVLLSPDTVFVSDSMYSTASEVFLGEFSFARYQDLWLQVTGGGSNMTITLDYLKVVPVLE